MDISKVVLSPVQEGMRKWWAWQHPVVPDGYQETHRMNGFIVDNVSYPGHPRVLFGSLHQPLTDKRCAVPLVPDPYIGGAGIVNVRFFFTDSGRYTYLPDAEKLFARRSELLPICCWRVRAHEHPNVDKLEQSLWAEGYEQQAQKLAHMRRTQTIILVTQLNRTWIKLYRLGITTEDAHLYQAFCYGPNP